MTEQKTGRGSASTPCDLDELLGPTPKKDYFKENLKEGEEVEAAVRYLHALEGITCYGVKPGVREDGTQPNYPKEQKDIVIYRESLFIPPKPWATTHPIESLWENYTTPEEYRDTLTKDNARSIEVKGFSKSFYPSIMLDCAEVWYQKTPEPTAVVLVQQSATFEELRSGAREHILVAHIPTVQGALKEVTRKVWNKATNSRVWKTNLEVPKELCWSWAEYLERFLKWHQEPSAIESWQDDGEHEGVYEDLLLQIVSNGTPLLNNSWATSPSE
jgi:hypothetical protein